MTRAVAIAAATLALACSAPAAQRTSTTAQASSGRATDPATSGVVTGVVRDEASGQPLSFAIVTVGDSATETTDANGAYRIDGVAPGEHAVTVHYANTSKRAGSVSVTAGSASTLDLTVGAPAATAAEPGTGPGSIVGTVSDQRTGETIEGAVVTLTSPGLRDAQLSVSDERGAYKALGLPPGTYTVSVYYSLIDYGGIEFRKAGVEVGPGQTVQIPIQLDTSVTAGPR